MEQLTRIIFEEKERSFPTFEEPIRVEVKNANEPSEVENESTSLEPEKLKRKLRRLFRR